MPSKSPKSAMVETFTHPAAGRSQRDGRYLAVRWRARASKDEKAELLGAAGVEPATQDDQEQSPRPRINQTDGLWWVQGIGGADVPPDAVAKLEASPLVEWVSPVYRTAAKSRATMFTVNPTRLYVKQSTVDGIGGVSALGAPVAVDSARTSGLPGYVALTVEDASVARGRTALEVARVAESAFVRARGPGDRTSAAVKYETIPFLSPTCEMANCSPPLAEFTPNDPLFALQWGLQRTGVPRAWEIARGSSQVTIAVIDEGVQLDHPDLDLHPQSWNAST